MEKLLVTAALVLGVAMVPARAFANDGSQRPVKLTDAQLDEVVGGDEHGSGFSLSGGHHHGDGGGGQGSLSSTQVTFIIRDVRFVFNIGPNSPVNLSTVFQFALLGNPVQNGSSTAFQTGH
jgi:hypothetical protein